MVIHYIPPQVRLNENSWHTTDIYRSTHYYSRDNSFFSVIGGNGTGKTFLALRNGEILGADEKGEQTLFNPDYLWEHVVFEKKELVNLISDINKLPANKARGYVIVVDEVQDALSSKEAMQEEVRAISSYLATLRSRRYIIYFTLPSWNMLVKDARRIMNYCHMMSRRPTTCSFSDLRVVKTDRFSDDPYLWRPRRMTKIPDPWSGMMLYHKTKWKPLTWDLPSNKTLKSYRKLKLEAQVKKGTKLKEKMVHAMSNKNELEEQKSKDFAEFVLQKIDSEHKASLLVKETWEGPRLNRTKLGRVLGVSSGADKTLERAFSILVDAYPKIFTGSDFD